jgi:hypothetical protein
MTYIYRATKELTQEVLDLLPILAKFSGSREKFDEISIDYKLSEDLIRKYYVPLHKNRLINIFQYQELSEEFIREFQNENYINYISSYQELSEDFIIEFKDKVNWRYISTSQRLSENFIYKNEDKIDFYYLLFNKDLKTYSKSLQLFILSKILDAIKHDYKTHKRHLTPFMRKNIEKISILI